MKITKSVKVTERRRYGRTTRMLKNALELVKNNNIDIIYTNTGHLFHLKQILSELNMDNAIKVISGNIVSFYHTSYNIRFCSFIDYFSGQNARASIILFDHFTIEQSPFWNLTKEWLKWNQLDSTVQASSCNGIFKSKIR
jgi:hypothetical protein